MDKKAGILQQVVRSDKSLAKVLHGDTLVIGISNLLFQPNKAETLLFLWCCA
jgi:hypothetical protein